MCKLNPLLLELQCMLKQCLTFHIIGFFSGYFFMNVSGVWFYNLTPIVIYLYGLIQGKDDKIGYVWSSWYPFDKHQAIAHVAVYLFEIFAGKISYCIHK